MYSHEPVTVMISCDNNRIQSHSCYAHRFSNTTDEGLRGRNVLHSLCVHSCASMLNNICSEYHVMLHVYFFLNEEVKGEESGMTESQTKEIAKVNTAR